MNTRKRVKYIHEGKYATEVDVDLIEDDTEWSPYLTIEDAEKLDDVRAALARGDIKEALKKACDYTLQPVAVKRGSSPTLQHYLFRKIWGTSNARSTGVNAFWGKMGNVGHSNSIRS